ncbi:MAG: glycosyltransferase [Thermodesulfobacteriota bacterium]|nr:glycosyltransferase [Thermodesulfobacteriota bacterium]
MIKKILFVHSEYDMYGSSVSLLNLCLNLSEKKYKPYVVLPREGTFKEVLEKNKIPVFIVKMGVIRRSKGLKNLIRYFKNTFLSTILIAALIKKFEIDIVHTNTMLVHAGGLAGRLTGRKVIWHIRELIDEPYVVVGMIFWCIKLLSDEVICISRAVKRNLVNFTGDSSAYKVIYNGVNLEQYNLKNFDKKTVNAARQALGFSKDDFIVGMVGRFAFWKGHDVFIHAGVKLLKQFNNVKFLIAGELDRSINREYHNGNINFLKKNNVVDDFVFTGFVRDMEKIYSVMDIVVVPSRRPEPFGLVAIEALAMGKPVIATNHGGTAEIISGTGLGVLVPPDDHDLLVRSITFFYDHRDIIKKINKKAPEYIEQHFFVKNYSKNVEKVYNKSYFLVSAL